ncbi:hypothetical protein [Streptomyces sp. NPDC006879]|uniref:hypothetical protein n=1 Tax=Streptomyces sp. NPDC006879 TaxID=3364767 RepID=UPI0036A8A7C9
MPNNKRAGRTGAEYVELVADFEDEDPDSRDALQEPSDAFRVTCPDCAQSIALCPEEERLPQHAVCLNAWNPFGITLCPGTGRTVAGTLPAVEVTLDGEESEAIVLALPQGLDWRTQPFSHVGGPGSRPVRLTAVPRMRRGEVLQAA